jgi:hypothetical protein
MRRAIVGPRAAITANRPTQAFDGWAIAASSSYNSTATITFFATCAPPKQLGRLPLFSPMRKPPLPL